MEGLTSHYLTVMSRIPTLCYGRINIPLLQGPRSYFESEGLTCDSKWGAEKSGGEGGDSSSAGPVIDRYIGFFSLYLMKEFTFQYLTLDI